MSGILMASVGNSYGYKPVNTVAPAVTGTTSFGQTLSCSTGTWNAAPPSISYAYQWYRSPSTSIGGATSSTYTLVAADVGNTLYCTVTASNAVGATAANSNTTATVAAIVPTAPTIGTATATSSTTATVSYTASSSNGGATITSYTAVSSPGGVTGSLATSGSGTITVSGLTGGTTYTFTVFATNAAGNSPSSSASNSVSTTPSIGQAYQGGFFAGQVNQSGTIYNLVVSPLSSGQINNLKYNTSFGGANPTSVIDGPANTAACVAGGASQQAAVWTDALTIGGYTDWYIPANNEWITMLYFLKPSTQNNYTPSGSNANAVSPEPVSTPWTTGTPARTTVADFQVIGPFNTGANALANIPGGPWYPFHSSTSSGTYNSFQMDSGATSAYCGYLAAQAKTASNVLTRAIRRVAA